MLIYFKKIVFFVSLAGLAFFSLKCKNDYHNIGLDVQPEHDQMNTQYTDTATIWAFSFENDTLKTGNLNNNVLGFVKDPTFGTTQADFCTQLRLSTLNVNFGTGSQLDSAVLSFAIIGFFGDTSSKMAFGVYELTEALDKNTTYFSNSTLNFDPQNRVEMPNTSISVRPNTPVAIDSGAASPQLRIRLDKNYINEKFFQKSGQPELADHDRFLNYFKGFHVVAETPQSGAGCAIYTDLNATASCLTIYYKDNQNRSQKYIFNINTDATRFNNFNHSGYAGATQDLLKQIQKTDTTRGEQVLFLQAGDGINAKLYFPYIKETFKNRRVILNKAELILTNISNDAAYFFIPQTLAIQKNTATGGLTYIPDDGTATYNTASKTYTFNITRYIQSLITTTEPDYGINIVISGSGIRLNRLIFAGPKSTSYLDKRLILKVTYSEY